MASGPRSPPRPSPGGLHYSDEDICNKYNGAVLTEGVNLKDKSLAASESEVSACAVTAAPAPGPAPRAPGATRHNVRVSADGRGRSRERRAQTRSLLSGAHARARVPLSRPGAGVGARGGAGCAPSGSHLCFWMLPRLDLRSPESEHRASAGVTCPKSLLGCSRPSSFPKIDLTGSGRNHTARWP